MRLLKPHELRIGNWYLSTKFQTPVKCEIGDFYELYKRAEPAALNEEDIASVFQPLILTEEILIEGLGFTKSNDSAIPHRDAYTFDGVSIDSGFQLAVKSYTVIYIGKELEYVHELQDLFNGLYGINLDGELHKVKGPY